MKKDVEDKRPAARRPGEGESGRRAHFAVVGIGSSAGGLDALKRFFSAMPADSGMAFVLIQHLDPAHENLTANLLAKHTAMMVVQVADRMPVEPNHVYAIPPNAYLTISDSVLHLSEPILHQGIRMPIDHFFRSLAEDRQERAIGIILSGTGSDGTLGVKAIKGHGGMAMVQAPETAQYDPMPRAAIATGLVDYIRPVEEMPEVLIRYVGHADIKGAEKPEVLDEKEPDGLRSILAVLRTQTQFDFRCYKKGMLLRQIRRRMSLQHIEAIADYVNFLGEDPNEPGLLFKDLLINVTGFFREPEAFKFLEEQVIPKLVQNKDPTTPLRVWVPGCATGEEPYSIAMLLTERLQAEQKHCPLQIFATDIDEDTLDIARAGVYPENIAADVSPERLRRFFSHEGQTCLVSKPIRESIVFAVHNLITDPPFSRLDLISCRNLLIYLEPEVQWKLIALFHYALVKGGYLFLGSAETVGRQVDLFEPLSKKWRIYRRLDVTSRSGINLPILPEADRLGAISAAAGPPLLDPARLSQLTQRLLLQNYAPAAVLIDANHQILYAHGPTDRYLKWPAGVPTGDLMASTREGLHTKLRTALHEAAKQQERVTVGDAYVRRNGAYQRVGVTVRPVKIPKGREGLLLISFEDEPELGSGPTSGNAAPGTEVSLVRQLEHELKTTREDLQSTIEELETTNEDIKVANEEILSMNEELQSTNEELETSKEELQSVNEELTTLNNELQDKLAELESTNNDLANLLSSTEIATLFLDAQFRIKRFTPAMTKLVNLIATDVGRPIGDMTLKFRNDDLGKDAEAVLTTLIPLSKEVHTHDGDWYIQRILPYRTQDNRLDGVVLTFVDITERKRAEQSVQEARHYAESIVATVRESLLVLNRDLQVISANQSFYQTFQVSPEATQNKRIYELGNRQWDIPELRTLLEEVLPERIEFRDYEVECEFPGIGRKAMRLNARQISGKNGLARLILLAIEDITEHKRAEVALRSSEQRYRALYDENPSIYFTVDAKGTVLSVNHFGAEQLGYATEELLGKSVFEIHHEEKHTAQENLEACVQRPDEIRRWESPILRKDGELLWVRETARAVEEAEGNPKILLVWEDISEARRLADHVSYQATHDSLTDLVNRREFEHRLERVLETARTAQTEHALCYLDLDQFKVINDSCGHLAGDALLRQLAGVLEAQVRKRDTVARLGGDEFGVLLEHCLLEQAQRVANALREAIEDFRFLWEEKTFRIGVSIGLVPVMAASGTMADVLKAADAACYVAKEGGRNRIHVYNEQDTELARRHGEMQWVSRIRRALEEGRFRLSFQPIVPVKQIDEERAHYELLIRMQDEDGRLVLPGAFLPAAERYNLSTRLDRWVVHAAFDWLETRPEHLHCLYLCAINLSGHSLGNEGFLDDLYARLNESRLPPEKICFEITETAAIASLSNATHFIKVLRELGCHFALDDFGSGLSSFTYLKTLPVDFLKIDGAFVKDIVDDPIDLAMVKSINEIGHVMGKKTIAEFVENDLILKKLREIGVDYAQGYGVGPPQPIEEMIERKMR